jgi:hypothetical protein
VTTDALLESKTVVSLSLDWDRVRMLAHLDNLPALAVCLIDKPISANGVDWLELGEDGAPWLGRKKDWYVFRFEGIADFRARRDGGCLEIYAYPDAEPSSISFALLRGVLPRLLHLRGIPCLHGSAVRVGNGAVAFLGASGQGKSTVVASLVARGFPLVTDDTLPLRMAKDASTVLVGPGLPEIRLYPGSAGIAGVTAHVLPAAPGQTKGRWYPAPAQLEPGPLPLERIYLLRPVDRPTQAIAASGPVDQPGRTGPGEHLTGTEAFRALTENSFWLNSAETSALANDMTFLARVATDVPIRWLDYHLSSPGMDNIASFLQRSIA